MSSPGHRTNLLGRQYDRTGVDASFGTWRGYKAVYLTQVFCCLSGGMNNLILNEISAAVKSQLDQQAALGVRIVQHDDVPNTGPVHGGAWVQIPEATAVFVDYRKADPEDSPRV